jgi:hypothetical protein
MTDCNHIFENEKTTNEILKNILFKNKYNTIPTHRKKMYYHFNTILKMLNKVSNKK